MKELLQTSDQETVKDEIRANLKVFEPSVQKYNRYFNTQGGEVSVNGKDWRVTTEPADVDNKFNSLYFINLDSSTAYAAVWSGSAELLMHSYDIKPSTDTEGAINVPRNSWQQIEVDQELQELAGLIQAVTEQE